MYKKNSFILVTKTNTWHDQQILFEAKKANVFVLKVDFRNWNEFLEIDWSFASIIIWRSSSLGQGALRFKALISLEKMGKIVINQGWTKWPMMPYKNFQQKHLAQFLKEDLTIDTFVFGNKKKLIDFILQKKELIFPIIKKPNLGFQGIGVSKINNLKEIEGLSDEEIRNSVFQNFIENDGDYRILVLGGRPIGVMKRVASEGGFLNNISQGGVGLKVDNEKLKNDLMEKAAKIATVFDLGFCGVDLIVDKKNSHVYFLEINTVPQWQGFQKTNKINVGKLIVQYICDLAERNKVGKVIQIEKFYSSTDCLPEDKKFHFYSRLYLWTKKKKYLDKLKKLNNYFIGGYSYIKQKKKIEELLSQKDFFKQKVINRKNFREEIVKKYPKLGVYHEILFRWLLAKSIYSLDLKKIILEKISQDDLLKIGRKILKNKADLMALSTFAVNYLFFLSAFLKNKNFELEIRKIITALVKSIRIKEIDNDLMKNNFYFLSHCIVAGSEFYSKKISSKDTFFILIFEKIETILRANFSKVSLDNKIEFLVCACLMKKKSVLEEAILAEIDKSFSPIGNFLIDIENKECENYSRKDFFSSEHRNVLYLMINYKLNLSKK